VDEIVGVPPEVADAIVAAASLMHRWGWVQSVAGNISARIGAERIAITRSGGRKGLIGRADVIAVDLEGRALSAGERPSAETLLHCQVYAALPAVGAVLHGHSVAATVLSRLAAGESIRLAGYEMGKALPGVETHEAVLELPVFDNDQDMRRLQGRVAARLRPDWFGYVLRGHGAYAWGRDLADAASKLEALEFMLQCELETRRISGREWIDG
jgi:methylthioribulose-1-phosphate dehydratase